MTTNSDSKLPKNGVPIDDAENWTKAWQTKYPSHSKAFLIPNTDLLSLLEEIGVLVSDGKGGLVVHSNPAVYGIRAYMAIGPDRITGEEEEKLVMVGTVDVKGEFQDQVKNSKDEPQVPLSGSGAFDFGRPCPKTCNVNSSLYHN
ncbi:hypothetical protein [Patiriisocius marinus]|uniref:Uncharacterized protein n=1 Tax=Patiriisocius marinus TaxID=1397112 RepID=A0A5J4IQV5_9FLAO|nr:hypothetical protein [Patiriisocius marinus]GER60275.1 hypothetical protein ULMA_23830 [Patiriisocius marinus]